MGTVWIMKFGVALCAVLASGEPALAASMEGRLVIGTTVVTPCKITLPDVQASQKEDRAVVICADGASQRAHIVKAGAPVSLAIGPAAAAARTPSGISPQPESYSVTEVTF